MVASVSSVLRVENSYRTWSFQSLRRASWAVLRLLVASFFSVLAMISSSCFFNRTRRQDIERATRSGAKRQSEPRQLIGALPRRIVEGLREKPVRARRFRMAEIETALSRAGTSLYPGRHRISLRRGRPYRRRAEP